jgi:hypothetical protein
LRQAYKDDLPELIIFDHVPLGAASSLFFEQFSPRMDQYQLAPEEIIPGRVLMVARNKSKLYRSPRTV